MVHGLRGVAFERLGQGITAGGARLANLNLPIPIGLNVECTLPRRSRRPVSPSYSPIAFTNRSSNSPPTRLTWKLLSPLVCVASTTVNPTDRDVFAHFGTAPGERLRLGLVDLFGRFGFWLFLGVGICGFLFGRLCVVPSSPAAGSFGSSASSGDPSPLPEHPATAVVFPVSAR